MSTPNEPSDNLKKAMDDIIFDEAKDTLKSFLGPFIVKYARSSSSPETINIWIENIDEKKKILQFLYGPGSHLNLTNYINPNREHLIDPNLIKLNSAEVVSNLAGLTRRAYEEFKTHLYKADDINSPPKSNQENFAEASNKLNLIFKGSIVKIAQSASSPETLNVYAKDESEKKLILDFLKVPPHPNVVQPNQIRLDSAQINKILADKTPEDFIKFKDLKNDKLDQFDEETRKAITQEAHNRVEKGKNKNFKEVLDKVIIEMQALEEETKIEQEKRSPLREKEPVKSLQPDQKQAQEEVKTRNALLQIDRTAEAEKNPPVTHIFSMDKDKTTEEHKGTPVDQKNTTKTVDHKEERKGHSPNK